MDVLKKIQKLPEIKRKIIFWTLLIIISLILLSLWTKSLRERYQGFNLKLPSFEKELENLPKLEIPNINE